MITRRLLLMAVLMFTLTITGLAQVRIGVSARSPMPASISAWTRDRSLVQITITNPPGAPAYPDARIAVVIRNSSTGAVVARTREMHPALPRLSIPPGPSTLVRFGPDVIDERAIDVDASYRDVARATNALPEGRYEFCVRLVDAGGRDLSQIGIACGSFNITAPVLPEPITPRNSDTLSANTGPRFTWTPGAIPGARPTYRLRIVPVYPGQTTSSALERNAPALERTISTPTYQYLPSDPPLDSYTDAESFAWGVTLLGPDGVALGSSSVQRFYANRRGGGAGPAQAAPCVHEYSMTICVGETIKPFKPKNPKVAGNTNPGVASGQINAGGEVEITGISEGATTITVEFDGYNERHELVRCKLIIKVTVKKCDPKKESGTGGTDNSGTGSGSTGGTGTGTGNNGGGAIGGNGNGGAGNTVPCEYTYNLTICVGETIKPFKPKNPKVAGNTNPGVASGQINAGGEVEITGISEGTTTITVEFDGYNERHELVRCKLIIKVTVKKCDPKKSSLNGGDGSLPPMRDSFFDVFTDLELVNDDRKRLIAGGGAPNNDCVNKYNFTICIGETIKPFKPKNPKVLDNSNRNATSSEIDADGWVEITGIAEGTSKITVEFDSVDRLHEPIRCKLEITVTVKKCDEKQGKKK